MSGGFKEPLGLALAGGGAHGAWQAGALRALTEAGLSFSDVLGFSVGALTGAGYALGIQDILTMKWRKVDEEPVLRFAPRLKPFCLCSGKPLWEAAKYAADEEDCRRRLRCRLTVVSLKVPENEQDYARFTPGGEDGWDGPLRSKLVASCAIPGVFPPVFIEVQGRSPQRFIDGGVPGKGWIRFDALAGCATVIALQMTRPEELGRFCLWPWDRFDQLGREVCALQMDSGIESLIAKPDPPRIYRLFPSKRLDYCQLRFKAKFCVPAMEQGYEDARRFLDNPEPFLARASDLRPAGPKRPSLPLVARI